MTEDDLQQIEAAVGYTLPTFYRTTLVAYPFPKDSFADEFMLRDCPQSVIANNKGSPRISSPDIRQSFFLGSDGGEERYFVDAKNPNSAVFVFELETGKHRQEASTWAEFLDQVRVVVSEIDAEEAEDTALATRRVNKNWWQFWL